MNQAAGHVFLFLQGPHGPFFRQLAGKLAAGGTGVRRIAFNPGADFTNMSPEGGGLCINFVRQKTFLEVYEEGTTAAPVPLRIDKKPG